MTKYPSKYPISPSSAEAPSRRLAHQAILETVPNPDPRALYLVRFAAPEFTSLVRP